MNTPNKNKIGVALSCALLGAVIALSLWYYQTRFSLSSSVQEPIKRTVMIYMIGSDLESQGELGSLDLEEMLAAGNSEYLKIVAQTGGADSPGWRTVKRISVDGDLLRVHEDLGKHNMASAQSLQDFMEWGMQRYPADRYSLIFWSHGSGAISPDAIDPGQVGPDEIFKDSLSIAEIQSAMSSIQKKMILTEKSVQDAKTSPLFEMIGFDACLMGSLEVAKQLAPFSHYLIASQELEPGEGMNYTGWLSELVKNPGLSSIELGKSMIDSYFEYFAAMPLDANKPALTMSLVNLKETESLMHALGSFAKELSTVLSTDPSLAWAIAQARAEAENYGRLGRYDFGMVDLLDFATRSEKLLLASNSPLGKEAKNRLKVAGQNLRTASGNFVQISRNNELRPKAFGISVFVPNIYHIFDKASYKLIDKHLFSLPFQADWLAMQKTYMQALARHPLDFKIKDVRVEKKMLKGQLLGDHTKVTEFEVAMVLNAIGDKSLMVNNWYIPEARETDNVEGINGNLIQAFLPEYILTFEGQAVATLYLGTEHDAYWYSVPAKVNGKPAFIKVRNDIMGYSARVDAYRAIDYQIVDEQWNPIAGARAGKLGRSGKGLGLVAGDKIQLHYPNLRATADSMTARYLPHYPEMTLQSSAPTMRLSPIPKGSYELRFQAIFEDGNSEVSANGVAFSVR